MNGSKPRTWRRLSGLLVSPGMEPALRASRIQKVQKEVILPVKLLLIPALIYYFYFSNWITQVSSTREVAVETLKSLFPAYAAINLAACLVFIFRRRISMIALEWSIFGIGVLDGMLLAMITLVTGGFESIVYWIFLALIIHNAISIPLAILQIVLNLLISLLYVGAGLLDVAMSKEESLMMAADVVTRRALGMDFEGISPEPYLLRTIVLLLMTACCYGLQALLERQRQVQEDAREFTLRSEQLQTAGRLAAEIAHQVKNPLAIINNAIFVLERGLKSGRASVDDQIRIIREEVSRADRILTELMGYAQLAEGRVEKLDVLEVLEASIEEVFPRGAEYETVIERRYEFQAATLLMQRKHLLAIFTNILLNAREVLQGRGHLQIHARHSEKYAVLVSVTDDGPGIPPDRLERIFEAYYTTKEKGSGLGLSIVKHNLELYGGSVQAKSELGHGTTFTLQFPARALEPENE